MRYSAAKLKAMGTLAGVSDLMLMVENSGPDQMRRLVTNDLRRAQMTFRIKWLDATAYAMTKRKLREPALSAWRERAVNGDAAIVRQWCSDETLAAIRAFVERTLK